MAATVSWARACLSTTPYGCIIERMGIICVSDFHLLRVPLSLPPCRYEWQRDHSLLGESLFEHDPSWVHRQVSHSLQYWRGERAACHVPREEGWKCGHGPFVQTGRPELRWEAAEVMLGEGEGWDE